MRARRRLQGPKVLRRDAEQRLTPIVLSDGQDFRSEFLCHGWSLAPSLRSWKSQGATR